MGRGSSSVLLEQQQQERRQQPQEPQRQVPVQRPVFGATVSRVQVDAIVTDGSGRFVDDLTSSDFVIYEDGEPQPVLDVQLIDLAAGSVTTLGNPDRAAGPSPGARAVPEASMDPETGMEPKANADGDPNARNAAASAEATTAAADSASDYGALVFLIDGPSLDLKTRRRFATAWEELIATTEGLRVPRAVYLVDSFGTLDELVPLTLDIEPLFEAVAAVRATPTPGNSMKSNFYELLNDMTMPEAIDAARQKARAFEQEETQRSLASFALLTQFCDALAARAGRTALIWVTTGVKITVGGPYTILTGEDPAAPTAIWERQQQLFDPYTPDARIVERQRRLHEAANSANVSIYTVDPTLRADLRSMDSDVSTRSSGDAERLSSMEFQSSLDSLRDSLKDAAAATGGQAFVYWTDLGEALATIERDSSRFYLLTYAAPLPEGDGEYHEIRVEVNRPGLTVRERGGYVDLPANERRARELIGALSLPGTVTGPPVRVRALRRWSRDGEPIVQLAVAFDPTGDALRNATTPRNPEAGETRASGAVVDGKSAPPLSPMVFHAVAVDDGGRVVDEVHQGVRSLFQPTDADALAGIWPFRYVYDWALPPGAYALRVVMEDELTGTLGATQVEVVVPDSADDWRTSDLVLATTNGSSPPLPLVVDEATEDTQLIVYVEVAGGDEPVLSGAVFSADGATLLSPLPPVSLQEEAGIHRGALRLEGLTAGEIIVQIAVTDALPARHRIFRRTLTIVSSIPPRGSSPERWAPRHHADRHAVAALCCARPYLVQ